MSLQRFLHRLPSLIERAQGMFRETCPGKPEENTKADLLNPFLEALGYGSGYRTLEGSIKSLQGTTTWVDYFLLPDDHQHPVIMVEAKSLWERDIWEKNKQQVLDYLRDYKYMIGSDEPVFWLVLSNFRKWYLLRLEDREPFWSFTMEDLAQPAFATELYERLARENLPRNRLQEFYTECQREGLGARFLTDLKIWRVILANGIRRNYPQLSLTEIKEASQTLLNRLLLIRLLEAYGQESFYSLARLYDYWQTMFKNKPFAEVLQDKFRDTWASYNTELFSESLIDQLEIPAEYLEPLILPDPVLQAPVAHTIGGAMFGYRSIYNYDFTTITQDVLGTVYEQFLAHELREERGMISVLENKQTRKREGVYYTPEYIVRRIVHQALEPQVRPKIDRAIDLLAEGEFESAYQEAKGVLQLRIVDPACGSGSFLLGAFDYLLSEIYRYNKAAKSVSRERAANNDLGDLLTNQERPKPREIEEPEEQLLVHVLHGVDLDPQAVSLAKLSLWTRLLRAKPDHYGAPQSKPTGKNRSSTEPEFYVHLPALTLNIRCGNSLIHSPASLSRVSSQLKRAAELAQRAKDLSLGNKERAASATEAEALLKRVEKEVAPYLTPYFASDESLRSVVKSIRGEQLDEEDLKALRGYLLQSRQAPPGWSEAELTRLRTELMSLETAQGEVLVKRPFTWQVEFPDLFDFALPEELRGFDVVVGNPPYFNVDATFGKGAPELAWLRSSYPEIYTDKTDILFYFVRRATQILRSGGELAFIVSRAFIQGDKAKGLRGFLAKNTTLLGILDFLGHKVFNAGIATCILHARNAPPPAGHQLEIDNVLNFDQVRKVLESKEPLAAFPGIAVTHVNIGQDSLGEERWSLSPYSTIFVIIDSSGKKLKRGEFGRFLKGIDTGLDEVFEGKFRGKFPDEWLRVRVPNSHIHKFGWQPSETQILYIRHSDNWDSLTLSVQQYLNHHKAQLEGRLVYQHPSSHYEWWQLHRPRLSLFSPKIFFPRRSSSNRFAVDEAGDIGFKSDVAALLKDPHDAHDIYYLCALLNSKVLEFRYRAMGGLGKLTGQGMFEYFENQVGDLPIPMFDDPEHNPDHRRLSELGKEAHQLFKERYQVVEA
ncbi:MAG TPA: type IV site-specific deoxyribonuclease Eco57I, partial [Candidatus Fraserbacteria bacterium]|nr:type IV site-specific deoxyribonuclease Eco57I [Candidatus Fraserbacteria bacterium]